MCGLSGRGGARMSGLTSRISGMMFMQPNDIGLFLRSARTDAALAELRARLGNRGAFDAIYADADPWASADPRYRYQRRKYDVIVRLLPERPYATALDLGCGTGLLARRLAERAGTVLGMDISAAAVAHAERAHAGVPNLRFAQGDILDLPATLDGGFDLLVLADTLYYLPPPLDDATLRAAAMRLARLLKPGGTCLLANHYFAGLDADSRLSGRIHRVFAELLRPTAKYWRPFYLVSILER
jgi:SAM-dependent methyltransferase